MKLAICNSASKKTKKSAKAIEKAYRKLSSNDKLKRPGLALLLRRESEHVEELDDTMVDSKLRRPMLITPTLQSGCTQTMFVAWDTEMQLVLKNIPSFQTVYLASPASVHFHRGLSTGAANLLHLVYTLSLIHI